MRFLSVAITAVIVSAASPTIANASEKQTFQYKDSTFVYKVESKNEVTIVKGTEYPSAMSFKLYLHNNRVTGNYGDQKIAFKQSEAQGAMNAGSATLLSIR
ncbi:MAG: hypothetical protein AB7U35_03970 [Sphingobium sp.]